MVANGPGVAARSGYLCTVSFVFVFVYEFVLALMYLYLHRCFVFVFASLYCGGVVVALEWLQGGGGSNEMHFCSVKISMMRIVMMTMTLNDNCMMMMMMMVMTTMIWHIRWF